MSYIIKKQYYKITFSLASPMILGSGFTDETDKDILKDAGGNPYIPASSLAGVCRDAIEGYDENDKKKYFGDVSTDGKGEAIGSRICFYDGICDGTPYISIRDGVGLDEYKVARKGAKFDMEVLEPGVKFVTYLEQNFYSQEDKKVAEDVAKLWASGKLYIGAKTMRGYGEICDVSVIGKTFDLGSKDGVDRWLSFDMYGEWEDCEVIETEAKAPQALVLGLKQVGGISIRKYTTEVDGEQQGRAMPDSEQLTIRNNGEEIPVIPGSSWAGAFLHRMKELNPNYDFTSLFGKMDKNNGNKKSVIRFSETQIEGATAKVLSRNAINRFSGGAADTALFTERTYYNGSTELKISWTGLISETEAGVLAACVADLNYGFLGVGGLTAIGRGLFKVETVNGQPVNDDEVYRAVLDILTKEK